ncbi:MAG: YWFCY domain-containing protein [Arachidicoccus sp.]|nr:YWFCY domain-containing protein [Arachidicoccus sp.]
MTTNTPQNDTGLKPLTDLTRWISIFLLLLHFYVECYGFFKLRGWTHPIGNRILDNIHKTGLFNSFNKAKLIALMFLLFSLFGAQTRKGEKVKYRSAIIVLLAGLILYFSSAFLFVYSFDITTLSVAYMSVTVSGYLLMMSGGSQLARIFKIKISGEVFNTENETFPQEERKLENIYSVNLPTKYRLKDRQRSGWINIINGFRGGVLLMGLPGSGKTLIAKEMLKQQIAKGFGMFIHDFKFPDLTTVAYNHFLLQRRFYKIMPTFHILNFEDLQERCNPLLPDTLHSITDAASASRAILLGLNQEWIEKQGDFWIESSVNFVTALIWFLRIYENGKYCTLPHVIELAQTPLDKLFSILQAEPSLEVLVTPFVRAYEEDAGKQLIGQISGAAISLGTLASEKLYYVLSGSDFSMQINDPKNPKIVCIANNPRVSNVYSAVISLYLNTLQNLLVEQQQQPCGILLEEFANISWQGIDKFLSVCRSYLVQVTLIIQDASQLILHYGKRQADVILSLPGNIISGQVTGDSAKMLSDRFGKILQDKESTITNKGETSVNRSKQLDYAIPQATIASLSAGEVVGVVADNPDQRIPQKMFHAEILHDFKALTKEEAIYSPLPASNVDEKIVRETFLRIKAEVKDLVMSEMDRIMNTPGMPAALMKKRSVLDRENS